MRKWDKRTGEKQLFGGCLYTLWLRTDHGVVFVLTVA